MSKQTYLLIFSALTVIPYNANSNNGNWSQVPIFNEAPLETVLWSDGSPIDPDMWAAILWNDGVNNRLDVVNIPPPYDGTGLSSTPLENTANLFALGSPCTDGTNVVVPYIKNFNVEVARYNGSSWSKSTLPDTVTNNFDNTHCAATQDGFFIGTHDLTDGETEIFKSNNGGASYTFYGRYNSSGPFDGAIREPLASNWGQRYIRSVFQQSNGMIRSCRFDTAPHTLTPSCVNIEQQTPPGGFTFVRESAGGFNGQGITFTYNSNGTAKALTFNEQDLINFQNDVLGPVNNNGSQFSFQGSTIITVLDENNKPMQNHVLWGDYYYIDTSTPFPPPPSIDNNYPVAGVGGPIDGCVVRQKQGHRITDRGFFVAPRVGPDGTVLYKRTLRSDPIFADGFESGNTAAWSSTCP
ncbi:hypothetical protein GCM10011365_20410 [Marinicella pacifica]|uniref:Uncharacterized protein n=1 Tax=Marinicella pacifica TaxID=1171543 RepID=A0A917CUU1_9GAMM|nr:hypothetical protein [Marinicella pacifica]GGF99029.1 hypothetical protein GCM10011365_20410 [Marinicella pacifica]